MITLTTSQRHAVELARKTLTANAGGGVSAVAARIPGSSASDIEDSYGSPARSLADRPQPSATGNWRPADDRTRTAAPRPQRTISRLT